MLCSSPTKSGTGILLEGDWYDLAQLYETLHKLAEYYERPETDQQNLQILGLAYEVRHAKQGDRLKRTTLDAGTYFGLRYTWPQLLSVVALLRQSLKWQPATPLDYAVLALLEAQIKQSLEEYDLEGSRNLIYLMEHGLNPVSPFGQIIDARVTINFLAQKGGKIRFRNLALLLENYWNPLRAAHAELVAEVTAAAQAAGASITDFEEQGWPEIIRW